MTLVLEVPESSLHVLQQLVVVRLDLVLTVLHRVLVIIVVEVEVM